MEISCDENNKEAVDVFCARKSEYGGMNLSQKVWKYTGQLKEEMETALNVSIGEGKSASTISREVRQYLQEPDKLFRRVRTETDEDGKPKFKLSENEVRTMPTEFQEWYKHNEKRIEEANERGTLPYFIRDNRGMLGVKKPLTTLEKAEIRHAKRTPEQIEDIKRRWEEREQNYARIRLSAEEAIKEAGQYAGIDTSELQKLLAENNLDKLEAETAKINVMNIKSAEEIERFGNEMSQVVQTQHRPETRILNKDEELLNIVMKDTGCSYKTAKKYSDAVLCYSHKWDWKFAKFNAATLISSAERGIL